MKKLIIVIIKMLPLFMLYRGAMKGHNRIEPLINIGKVMLSQYEIKTITDLVVENYKATKGKLISQQKFSEFLRKNYHHDYTMLARKVLMKGIDYSLDVWLVPFQINIKRTSGEVTIFSAGPDQKGFTKDDIKLSFTINGYEDVSKYKTSSNVVDDIDQYDDVYDEQNIQHAEFDSQGYDRNGYDRDGYDHSGFNDQGVNRDGYTKEELQELQREEQAYDDY